MTAITHIEFAHIYNDKSFGEEQQTSIEILQEVTMRFHSENQPYVTSVLIDNFNVEQQKWEVNYLLEHTAKWGVIPDMVAFEGSFTEVAESIIEQIPSSFKKYEYFRKEKKHVLFFQNGTHKFALKDIYDDHVRHKCVILSTAWLLCKLGVKSYPKDSFLPLKENTAVQGNRIVSILDKKYEKVEQNVLRLLSSLGLEEEKKKIDYIFY